MKKLKINKAPPLGVYIFKPTGELLLVTMRNSVFHHEVIISNKQKKSRVINFYALIYHCEWLGNL